MRAFMALQRGRKNKDIEGGDEGGNFLSSLGGKGILETSRREDWLQQPSMENLGINSIESNEVEGISKILPKIKLVTFEGKEASFEGKEPKA